MGVFIQVFLPVASLRGVSVYPPTANLDPTATPVIPTSQNALENAVSTHSNGILSVPAFLEEWVLSPEAVNQLSKFLYVVCTSPSALHRPTLMLAVITRHSLAGHLRRRRETPS